MKGLIFSIKRYTIHDGPGIRVTIFMKGCPLACRWCHNPEGISRLQEKVVKVCRIGEREFNNTEIAGEYFSVEEIISLLGRERIFMDHSGGGVTFSGGEPMLQTGFMISALKRCREAGFHTTVDTSGYTKRENFTSILPYTDLFLFDIKHLDAFRHIEATGVPNEVILENYRYLLEHSHGLALRIPIIPGFNDDMDYISRLREFVISSGAARLKYISLLPYHKTGSSKYRRLNLPDRMKGTEPPSQAYLGELRSYFNEAGITVKIGG